MSKHYPSLSNFQVWSTYRFNPGSSLMNWEVSLFQSARGSLGQGKVQALDGVDTNLLVGNSLKGNGPDTVQLQKVHWEIIHSDPVFAQQVACSTVWSWQISNWQQYGVPLSFQPIVQQDADPYAFAKAGLSKGAPAVLCRGEIPTDVKLPAATHFAIRLQFGNEQLEVPANGGWLKIRFLLVGNTLTSLEIG